MHLRDFLWFLICVALLLATLRGDARDHPHFPEPPYGEFAEWLDNTALTGTAASEIPWYGLISEAGNPSG